MSKSYSAHQFENAFTTTRMQNWEAPKPHKDKSTFTNSKHKVNDDMKKDEFRKLSDFVGTWDMPRKLPSAVMNVRTGRSDAAYKNLQEEFRIPREILSGQRLSERNYQKKGNHNTTKLQRKNRHISKNGELDDVVVCCNSPHGDVNNVVSFLDVDDMVSNDVISNDQTSSYGAPFDGRIGAF